MLENTSDGLAHRVARRTQLTQATPWSGPIWCLGQGTLTGRLARAIHIKDQPVDAGSIPQPPGLLLFGHPASQQILKKERA